MKFDDDDWAGESPETDGDSWAPTMADLALAAFLLVILVIAATVKAVPKKSDIIHNYSQALQKSAELESGWKDMEKKVKAAKETQRKAEEAKAKAEAAQTKAQAAAKDLQKKWKDMEEEVKAAKSAQAKAEKAQTRAEEAKNKAEEAQSEAETARDDTQRELKKIVADGKVVAKKARLFDEGQERLLKAAEKEEKEKERIKEEETLARSEGRLKTITAYLKTAEKVENVFIQIKGGESMSVKAFIRYIGQLKRQKKVIKLVVWSDYYIPVGLDMDVIYSQIWSAVGSAPNEFDHQVTERRSSKKH